MDHDPWLVKEVRRLTSDLHNLQTGLELIPHKFSLGYSDADAIVVIGNGEWNTLTERASDAREELIHQLNDFIENEFERQLHWSALRMLTAAGVLNTELSAFHRRLIFIVARSGPPQDEEVERLAAWFEGQLLPVSQRLSARLLQLVARVLDPESWTVEGALTGGTAHGQPFSLAMSFRPDTDNRWRRQKEKERRLARVKLD